MQLAPCLPDSVFEAPTQILTTGCPHVAKPPSAHKRSRKASARRPRVNLWGKDDLLIERMSEEGRGVASREGKVVFVSGALPGEQVRVQCIGVKRDYDEADTIELLVATAPSDQRVEPPCPVYGDCGGCSLQHWAHTAQQQHKAARLQAMLQALAPKLVLDPPIESPAAGFRHRLRLLVQRADDNSFVLGLRRRNSHTLVALPQCTVANSAINALLPALPPMLSSVAHLQGLREIEIDADTQNRLGLCFYFAANPGEKNLAELSAAVISGPIVALRVLMGTPKRSRDESQYSLLENEPNGNWRELHTAGELQLALEGLAASSAKTETTLQLAYLPGDFTQTHWGVNAALVARALDWLQPKTDERALDLFSGIGNFSLPIARRAKTVLAIEGNAAMVQRVTSNAQYNGIENITAKKINLLADTVTLPAADIAILDPPRAGAKVVCQALAKSKLQRVLYVSCHPATLVRDAKILRGSGFRLTRAAAVAMFPHTGHSEGIALFERPRAKR